jgi:hypothetical protein
VTKGGRAEKDGSYSTVFIGDWYGEKVALSQITFGVSESCSQVAVKVIRAVKDDKRVMTRVSEEICLLNLLSDHLNYRERNGRRKSGVV